MHQKFSVRQEQQCGWSVGGVPPHSSDCCLCGFFCVCHVKGSHTLPSGRICANQVLTMSSAPGTLHHQQCQILQQSRAARGKGENRRVQAATWPIRVFIMLGLIINAACAITVFVFTQTQRDPHGGISSRCPRPSLKTGTTTRGISR